LLKGISERLGGIEGQTANSVNEAIQASGMTIKPEIKAALSDDPLSQNLFRALNDSKSKSAAELKETYLQFKKEAGDTILGSLGKEPNVKMPEFSEFESGKSLGQTLAKEYESKVSPLSKE